MEENKIDNTMCRNDQVSEVDLPDFSEFPHKKVDLESALKAAHAIRKDVDDYIREYNLPIPNVR